MIEWIAAGLGLVSQWLTIHRRIACWPVGIVSVLLYFFVFQEQRLYSDMLLQCVYVVLQGYGWWHWLQASKASDAMVPAGASPALPVSVPVVRLPASRWLGLLVLGMLGAAALGTVMSRYTDAGAPYADATATTLSLAGQWLQARKVLESWLVFIVANIVFIAIYLVKGLYPTVGLFVVLTALAVAGFLRWRAAYRSQP